MTASIDHDTAVELLPWLVNETLHGDERLAVERHVRDCLPCRAALKEERRLAVLMREEISDREAVNRNFDRLVERLDHLDRQRPAARAGTAGGIARAAVRARAGASRAGAALESAAASAGVGLRAAAAAALLAVLAAGVGAWQLLGSGSARDSATFSTAAEAGARDGLLIDIVFAEGVRNAQIGTLVEEIDGTIVGGPSGLGRYTVRLPEGSMRDGDLTALLTRLGEDERVRFAGRSFIADPEP